MILSNFSKAKKENKVFHLQYKIGVIQAIERPELFTPLSKMTLHKLNTESFCDNKLNLVSNYMCSQDYTLT